MAISADGNRVITGTPKSDVGFTDAGQARFFEYDGTDWNQVGSDISGIEDYDLTGFAVSMSADGNRIAVSSLGRNLTGNDIGSVQMYDYNGSNWTPVGASITGGFSDDQFGFKVSLSSDGSRVAASSFKYNSNRGQVKVFQFNGSNWSQLGSEIEGDGSNEYTGYDIWLAGNGSRIAVGTPFDNYGGNVTGSAKVFEYSNSNWVQVGSTLYGQMHYSNFGLTLSISEDGNRLAVGAYTHDNDNGRVRVFDYTGGSWSQVGNNIDGTNGERLGLGLAISPNGNRLVFGSMYYSGIITNAGRASIYELSVAPCSQPTGVNISAITANTATYNWSGDTAATGWQIQYRPCCAGNPKTAIAGSGVTSKLLKNLAPGTSYQSRIRRFCQGGAPSLSVYRSFSTAVARLTAETSVTVYPNPNDGVFAIAINRSAESGQNVAIEITNSMGQVVYQREPQEVGAAVHPVNLTSLPSGQYFVKISTPAETTVKSLLLTK